MIAVDVARLHLAAYQSLQLIMLPLKLCNVRRLCASSRISNQRIPVTWYEVHSRTETRGRTWWILPCYDINNHRTHRDISLKTKVNFCTRSWSAIQISTVTIWILYYVFTFFNHFNICILTLLLQTYDIPNHYCIFLCWIRPWRWQKKTETCRRFTICLYTVGWACTAQSVQRLATGWTVRGSNPGTGEIIHTRPDRP